MRVPEAVRQVYELRTVLPAFRRYLDARKQFEMRDFEVDGRRLSARRFNGTSTGDLAVVVVPGLGLAGDYLLPLAARVGDRYPTWVPVMPGFGRSEAAGRPLDPAGMADALAGWMGAASIAEAVLVANSYGCQVAVEMARRHPELVAGMVLEGPTMDADARSLRAQAFRIVRTAPFEAPSLWFLQPSDWLRTSPRVLWGTVRTALEHRVEDSARGAMAPTLVIAGVHDKLVPKAWADRLTEALPHAGSLRLKHGSHANGYSDPAELARHVFGFIDQLERARAGGTNQ